MYFSRQQFFRQLGLNLKNAIHKKKKKSISQQNRALDLALEMLLQTPKAIGANVHPLSQISKIADQIGADRSEFAFSRERSNKSIREEMRRGDFSVNKRELFTD
ncbi:hypothetical protein CDAR_416781 [Caerostris darwini]|uniref:Uncharacterized protein n=1 Tax=Caerostris darwini TaxID=1538125 RepID=A0AAV4X6S4_9ARAC|nr:hypothetical protein CDAR_416781 [Caerostris darwini]